MDVVIERCINHSRALHALRLFKSLGIPCVNTYDVSQTCGDKILTAYTPRRPDAKVRNAFTPVLHNTLQAGKGVIPIAW